MLDSRAELWYNLGIEHSRTLFGRYMAGLISICCFASMVLNHRRLGLIVGGPYLPIAPPGYSLNCEQPGVFVAARC